MKKETKRATIKQGRNTLEITTTIDPERNVERREVVMKRRRKTTRSVFEIDLATGKMLPPPGRAAPPEGSIAEQLEAAIVQLTDTALNRKDAPDDDHC